MITLAALSYFLLFIGCGVLAGLCVFASEPRPVAVWLGVVCGFAAMMWLPALAAFMFGFGAIAHATAGAVAVLLTALIWWKRKAGASPAVKSDLAAPVIDRDDIMPLLLSVGLPMFVGAYMIYTHTLLEKGGALYTGQSCFGDLCLHLGIVQSLVADGRFPPDYSILPGAKLCYPFLGDALSASLRLTGMELRPAFMLPGIAALALVLFGFYALAKLLLRSRVKAALACVLFFIGGGFGFAYFLDMSATNPEQFLRIFTAFYEMPTNYTDFNVRWTNPIVDMMVPQRTLLMGWLVLIPCLYLLYRAAFGKEKRLWLPLAVLAGALPMIHTHSFLALVFLSLAVSVQAALRERDAREWLATYGQYALIAGALAVPQLLYWTFQQSTSDGGSFLNLRFNWANSDDWPLWFYIKNLGLIGILLPLCAAVSPKQLRRMTFCAIPLWIVCEFVLFQPNPYDNNKLLLVCWMLACIVAAEGLVFLWNKLAGIPARGYAAGVVLTFSLFSGVLTFGRGLVSQEFMLFSSDQAEAAAAIERVTPGDAVFLTALNHNNAVSSLAGRRLVCGTDTYLFFHGIDTTGIKNSVKKMFAFPEQNTVLFDRYEVDYVYLGDYERGDYQVDEGAFERLYPLAYRSQGDDVSIYAVSARAQASIAAWDAVKE